MELPRQQHADLGSAVKPEAAAAHFQGKMPARYATASKRLATQRDRKQEYIPALLSPSLYRLYPSLSLYPYLPQPMHTQIHTYIHVIHASRQTLGIKSGLYPTQTHTTTTQSSYINICRPAPNLE